MVKRKYYVNVQRTPWRDFSFIGDFIPEMLYPPPPFKNPGYAAVNWCRWFLCVCWTEWGIDARFQWRLLFNCACVDVADRRRRRSWCEAELVMITWADGLAWSSVSVKIVCCCLRGKPLLLLLLSLPWRWLSLSHRCFLFDLLQVRRFMASFRISVRIFEICLLAVLLLLLNAVNLLVLCMWQRSLKIPTEPMTPVT